MSWYQDKVVWITGASSGIGESLALDLARQGATLLLTARREERLSNIAKRCPHPNQVHALPADLFDESQWAGLADRAMAAAGRVDVLINNAGMSQRASAQNTLPTDVRRLMELNFFAPVGLTNAVLPTMIARGSGRIVIISSVSGYIGTPLRSTYAASKHAVRGYFDSLRAELHGTGVGVTIVCPGYVRTELSLHAVSKEGRSHGQTDEVIERGLDPDKCAKAIATAVARGRSELHIGGKEIYAIYVKRFAPKLIERVVPGLAPK